MFVWNNLGNPYVIFFFFFCWISRNYHVFNYLFKQKVLKTEFDKFIEFIYKLFIFVYSHLCLNEIFFCLGKNVIYCNSAVLPLYSTETFGPKAWNTNSLEYTNSNYTSLADYIEKPSDEKTVVPWLNGDVKGTVAFHTEKKYIWVDNWKWLSVGDESGNFTNSSK